MPDEKTTPSGNTHYAVVHFSGDPAGEHPDPELNGKSPSLTLIACGSEAHCWDWLDRWLARHPLRMWERGEVVMRDPSIVCSVAQSGGVR